MILLSSLYPTCRFIETHIFGYTLDWTWKILYEHYRDVVVCWWCDETTEKKILREWNESLLNVSGRYPMILTAALTHIWETRQLTTFFRPIIFPRPKVIWGWEWNCLRITNFHLHHPLSLCFWKKVSHLNFFPPCLYLSFLPLHSIIIKAINHHTFHPWRSTSWVFS